MDSDRIGGDSGHGWEGSKWVLLAALASEHLQNKGVCVYIYIYDHKEQTCTYLYIYIYSRQPEARGKLLGIWG